MISIVVWQTKTHYLLSCLPHRKFFEFVCWKLIWIKCLKTNCFWILFDLGLNFVQSFNIPFVIVWGLNVLIILNFVFFKSFRRRVCMPAQKFNCWLVFRCMQNLLNWLIVKSYNWFLLQLLLIIIWLQFVIFKIILLVIMTKTF